MTDTVDASSPDEQQLEELLNQGIARHQELRFEEAEALYRAVLARNPRHGNANHNLGVLLAIQLLRPRDALPYFELALDVAPDSVQFWFSYIDALIRAEQGTLARELVPLARSVGLPTAMANALMERIEAVAGPVGGVRSPSAGGSSPPVEPAVRETAEPQGQIRWPLPAANKLQVGTKKNQEPPPAIRVELVELFRRGAYEEGEGRARSLLEHYPKSAFLWRTLGVMLMGLGEMAQALIAERKAVALAPLDAEAHSNLGNLLQVEDRLYESVSVLQRAIQLKPNYVEAYNNLANTYQRLGRVEPALKTYQRTLELQPDFRIVYSNYLFTLNYAVDRSAEDIYAVYEDFEEKFGRPLRSSWRVHTNDRTPGRRLKVGYVSPDFREHAARNFAEPLLACHDKSMVEVYAYAELRKEDETTQRYKTYVDHWVPTRGMSDEALAERIRADGIDVLVDLAGHTQGNRLEVFARKPAPVSVSWMGFGYTTGLKAINYYLTDAICVPPGFEHLFSEMPWRLPDWPYTAYRPGKDMGEVSELPALQNGYVTFGTLTRSVRINRRTVRVWSELLRLVPGSRLVIDSTSYKDPDAIEETAQLFVAQGVERDRLHIGCHSPPWDVLRGVDIGLDCFPQNSGTTLFETLYMGIPYVTLADRPSLGRLGSAILHGLGHPEWIAESEQEYIDKVVALAADLPALAQIRGRLRSQMQASKLMDEAGFARQVERAYREMFEKWTQSSPERMLDVPPDEEMHRLVELFNRGDFKAGEDRALALTQRYPAHGYSWKLLGSFRQKLDDLNGALEAKKKAASLLPGDMEALFNLGLAYEKLGFVKEAETSYRRLLRDNPKDAEVLNNLGNALWLQQRLSEAEEFYRKALDIRPELSQAYGNLGSVLAEQGKPVEEETLWRRALRAFPENKEAYQQLARALIKQGRLLEADAAIRAGFSDMSESLGHYFMQGVTMHELGKQEEAEEFYRKALALDPDCVPVLNNFALVAQDRGRYREAEGMIRRALALRPKDAGLISTLTRGLQLEGRVADALACYQQAIAYAPNQTGLYGNKLFILNYDPDLSAEEIYAAYEEFEEKFGAPLRGRWRVHANDRNLERRLKVGYVSPDFKRHACHFFMEPLIANHDRAAVEVYAYADLEREDATTQRYKSYVEHWVPTRGMSDEALAERIRADGIDILVDLAGHTAGNRLSVFARKPAPVSLSWMGFGYTTGLKAIDYYLTDEASAPPGSEHLFSETPWRLPDSPYTAYRPGANMGEVSELPALRNGYVTFGTLTRSIRINHRTIRAWAKLLRRVPGSKLVIDSISYQDPEMVDELVQRFVAQGVARERLLIGFHSPPWDVMRGVDIGLDCFPHNSGTTLFETLYMGIPYVTLAGRPSVGRMGGAILHGVGHPEWIGESEEDYIDKAVALASDLAALAHIRANLRPQMQASKLMDEVGFARKVEQAYREMFQQWVERSA